MDKAKELTLSEIERCFPDQWVLAEETAWDEQGNPIRGFVRAHSSSRDDLQQPLRELHRRSDVKTFIFYSGEKIPQDLTVVL